MNNSDIVLAICGLIIIFIFPASVLWWIWVGDWRIPATIGVLSMVAILIAGGEMHSRKRDLK